MKILVGLEEDWESYPLANNVWAAVDYLQDRTHYNGGLIMKVDDSVRAGSTLFVVTATYARRSMSLRDDEEILDAFTTADSATSLAEAVMAVGRGARKEVSVAGTSYRLRKRVSRATVWTVKVHDADRQEIARRAGVRFMDGR